MVPTRQRGALLCHSESRKLLQDQGQGGGSVFSINSAPSSADMLLEKLSSKYKINI